MAHPIKALLASLRGPRTEGPLAPEIDLSKQRPAEAVHDRLVAENLERIQAEKARQKAALQDAAE